jgi:hypothetical protein
MRHPMFTLPRLQLSEKIANVLLRMLESDASRSASFTSLNFFDRPRASTTHQPQTPAKRKNEKRPSHHCLITLRLRFWLVSLCVRPSRWVGPDRLVKKSQRSCFRKEAVATNHDRLALVVNEKDKCSLAVGGSIEYRSQRRDRHHHDDDATDAVERL